MKIEQYQIPRSSLLWIMSAQIICAIPHLDHTPFWAALVAIVCMVWRFLIFLGRLDFPLRRAKICLALLCFLFVFIEYQHVYSLEPAITLLMLTYFLKLIELHRLKDAYVILTLSYFLIAVEFVYSTDINIFIYMFTAFCTVTAAMLAINQSGHHRSVSQTLGSAVKLCILSVPCALVLFVLFPRLDPLWEFNIDPGAGVIGLSKQMTPGDISNLGRSNKLAFRADFYNGLPSRDQLYWRVMVYSHFDGRTWATGVDTKHKNNYEYAYLNTEKQKSEIDFLGETASYRVTLEPNNQDHLVALQMPMNFDKDIAMNKNFNLVAHEPTRKLKSYHVVSSLRYKADLNLDPLDRARELQLPMGYNLSTRKYALRLFNTLNKNPEAMIQFILNKFNTEPYIYTLNPPLMGRESIDDFLFIKQRGFCAHYASAFVFLMRSVGIPARVVGGYQGGEVNPIGNHVLVHEYDAHAWAEVWLEGEGWVTFDPTAFVAPQRIELGLEQALTSERFLENNLFASVRYRDNPFVSKLRYSVDYLNHQWNQVVINYDTSAQHQFLSRWFGKTYVFKSLFSMFLLLLLTILMTSIFLSFGRKIRTHDEIDRLYLKWTQTLSRDYVPRLKAETPRQYLKRLSLMDLDPLLLAAIVDVTDCYESIRYAVLDATEIKAKTAEFRRTIRTSKKYLGNSVLSRFRFDFSFRC